jgi:hypothetical protein
MGPGTRSQEGRVLVGSVEEYERELRHVQGNFPEDTKRIADIKAEIAKAKKAKGEPAGLEPGERHPDGWVQDGRRETPVNPQEGNPEAVPAEPVEAVGNPRRKTVSRRRRKPAAKKATKPGPFAKEKAVKDPGLNETRG